MKICHHEIITLLLQDLNNSDFAAVEKWTILNEKNLDYETTISVKRKGDVSFYLFDIVTRNTGLHSDNPTVELFEYERSRIKKFSLQYILFDTIDTLYLPKFIKHLIQ